MVNEEPTVNKEEHDAFHTHQILANGLVIYTGENWVQAFLDAAAHPEYGKIVHLQDGVPQAYFSPVLSQHPVQHTPF